MNSSFIYKLFPYYAREESKDHLLQSLLSNHKYRVHMHGTSIVTMSGSFNGIDCWQPVFFSKGDLNNCLVIGNAKGRYGREGIRQDACRAHVSSHSPLD